MHGDDWFPENKVVGAEHSYCRNVSNGHRQRFSLLWGYQVAEGTENTLSQMSVFQKVNGVKRLRGVTCDVHYKQDLETIGGSVGMKTFISLQGLENTDERASL